MMINNFAFILLKEILLHSPIQMNNFSFADKSSIKISFSRIRLILKYLLMKMSCKTTKKYPLPF